MRLLHLFSADYDAESERTLLRWVLEHGAEAFTVDVVGTAEEVPRISAALDAELAGFEIDVGEVARVPEGSPGATWTRPAQLWRATDASLQVLYSLLGGRLLGYYPEGAAWLENPVIYRRSEVMLAVESHEGEGFARLWETEVPAFEASGLRWRGQGKWTGY